MEHRAAIGPRGMAERNEAMARAWARGASYHGLGWDYGLTPPRVRAIIVQRPDFEDLEAEREGRKRAELDRLAAMYREGLSLAEIGRRTGFGVDAVSYRLRKHPAWNELRAAKAAAREELGERVVQLYGRGERIADIARRLGIGYQRAQWILHQHPDWPTMKRSHWTKRTSPERHARIRELHAREWSAEDTAREVGYSARTVYEVIRRAELGMGRGATGVRRGSTRASSRQRSSVRSRPC